MSKTEVSAAERTGSLTLYDQGKDFSFEFDPPIDEKTAKELFPELYGGRPITTKSGDVTAIDIAKINVGFAPRQNHPNRSKEARALAEHALSHLSGYEFVDETQPKPV